MNDTAASPEQKSPDNSYLKISWAVLILISLYVSYFSHLGAFGFTGPDEPRYAWIARDMAETGDWVTPRLYGKPWFEKPILYYWGAALSFKLFGVSEVAARLPSALSALLATMALAWLALRLGGWELARWLLLLLPTSIGMLGFAHAAAPDMPFAAVLTIAMVCAAAALGIVPPAAPNLYSVETKLPDRYLYLFLFGFFLGASVLAKGPAGIMLAGGAMLLFAVCTRRWRDILHLLHPIALAALLLTALPWYILCARGNTDFFRVFIIEHNFNRYLTPEFQHIQPLWYYIPITLIALLPWVFWLAWFALREGRVTGSPSERTQILFLTAWGVFPLLFFSLSKSKLPGYILPAVPALGLLIAWAVAHNLASTHLFSRCALSLVGVFFVVFASGVFLSGRVGGSFVFLYVLFAGLGGLVIICGALLRHTRSTLIFAVVLMLIMTTFGYVSASKLDPQLSARRSTAQIDPARAVNTYSFQLQRAWQYQFNYYLHREIPEWNPDTPGEAIVITTEKHLAELKNSAEIVSIISDVSPQGEVVVLRPRPSAHNVSGGGQTR
jgi:Dolichyl-phosphate-mannose-protein mannosyltransferase